MLDVLFLSGRHFGARERTKRMFYGGMGGGGRRSVWLRWGQGGIGMDLGTNSTATLPKPSLIPGGNKTAKSPGRAQAGFKAAGSRFFMFTERTFLFTLSKALFKSVVYTIIVQMVLPFCRL